MYTSEDKVWFSLPGKAYLLSCLLFTQEQGSLAYIALIGFLPFVLTGVDLSSAFLGFPGTKGMNPLCPSWGLCIAEETYLVSHNAQELYKIAFFVLCLSFLSLGLLAKAAAGDCGVRKQS